MLSLYNILPICQVFFEKNYFLFFYLIITNQNLILLIYNLVKIIHTFITNFLTLLVLINYIIKQLFAIHLYISF